MPGLVHIWLAFRRCRQGPCLAVLAGLVLAGCAGPWPLESRPGATPDNSYDRGATAFAAGHFGLATKAFGDALQQTPDSVPALNGLAAAYDHLGRPDMAARYYGRAMAVAPGSPQTLNNIGYSYMLQGKFDLAVVFLREAQQRESVDPAIAANLRIAEAALQASHPRPPVQWRLPSSSTFDPRVRIDRATPVVQTMTALRMSHGTSSNAAVTRNPPAWPAAADPLPPMRASPIGDTRMALAMDRLPRPIAAAMTDAWIAGPQISTNEQDKQDALD